MLTPEQQRMHQVLFGMLFVCAIGTVRSYLFVRTEKGKSLPSYLRALIVATPPILAIGISLYLRFVLID